MAQKVRKPVKAQPALLRKTKGVKVKSIPLKMRRKQQSR